MSTITMPSESLLSPGTRIELNVFQRAYGLSVQLGAIGSKRKVNSDSVEVDADKALISVSKTLLESPEVLAIKQLLATVRQYLYSQTVRPDILRAGVYLLPRVTAEEVDQQLVDYSNQLRDLVDNKLLAPLEEDPTKTRYEQIQERDRIRLRSVFNPKDYPSPAKVRESCFIKWDYIEFGVPESLPDAIKGRENEKAAERVAQAAEQIQQLLRVEMLDLVSHISDRLEPGAGGKPRIFRDTLVTNIKDFLKFFAARNLTDDIELEKLCQQAQALLDGIDPQVLRDRSDLRERVQKGFSDIKAQLDGMVVTEKPRRLISMEEEE